MDKVINLDSEEAREYFLKGESYCNFSIPPYFDFNPLINNVYDVLDGAKFESFYRSVRLSDGSTNTLGPRDFDDVNFFFLNNKDGRFAWRPLQIIHPALYVRMVKELTSEKNWELVQNSFFSFRWMPTIESSGIPVRKSEEDKSDEAAGVKKWWSSIELRSIDLALEYEYIFHTDISDCYGSIYTYSIPWALHSRQKAKKNRGDDSLIGNCLDWRLQDMSHGQTNGIPQGSTLMDFVAEIVLGYADSILYKKLYNRGIKEYEILRYRDDYRIFTNNPQKGESILKCLTEVLFSLNMELNPEKTYSSGDVIEGSIKPDKMHWILSKQKTKSLRKHLLIIHQLSKKFPNSGSLSKALDNFYNRIKDKKYTSDNPRVLISIITDIAYRNPRVYNQFAAILSHMLYDLKSTKERISIIKKIENKLDSLPNTSHLSMWLQRITICSEIDYDYREEICRKVVSPSTQIWNSRWIDDGLEEAIVGTSIVNEDIIDHLSPKIQGDEFKLFSPPYGP
jgi:hypothetical protein